MLHYPKTITRPVEHTDLPALLELAENSGPGMTNLPKDKQALTEKIETSIHSFGNGTKESELLGYFFVLEDFNSKKLVGCSGIMGAGSHMMPFYHFKMSNVKYVNNELGLSKNHKILTMVNDYQGCTEICSLFLLPGFREHHNGSLLSRSRFMFMAEFPDRFNKTIIAEMRGVMEEDGSQPFWDNVISHFIDLPFLEADRLTGRGVKQFISDMMPRYPIYVEMLPKAAQNVIDKVHKDTRPALAMLLKEGFASHGYIDIFEAGTMVECKLNNIRTVKKSNKNRISEIKSGQNIDNNEKLYLISNADINFKTCVANLDFNDNNEIIISEEVASALNLVKTDYIRYSPLRIS